MANRDPRYIVEQLGKNEHPPDHYEAHVNIEPLPVDKGFVATEVTRLCSLKPKVLKRHPADMLLSVPLPSGSTLLGLEIKY